MRLHVRIKAAACDQGLSFSLQEQLRVKDEALSALAQQLIESEEEVARLRAGSKKVEQPVTDDVKVVG